MFRALTYFESIFNGIIMIILDVGTWYDLYGLNCQKEKNQQVPSKCFSHALDSFGLGAWQ